MLGELSPGPQASVCCVYTDSRHKPCPCNDQPWGCVITKAGSERCLATELDAAMEGQSQHRQVKQ